jgi:hypothetical protein
MALRELQTVDKKIVQEENYKGCSCVLCSTIFYEFHNLNLNLGTEQYSLMVSNAVKLTIQASAINN